MSKYNFVFDLDKLKDRADEVNPIDAQETVKALIIKLKKYKVLYALCAPQLGVKERVIVFKYKDSKKKDVFKEYINPKIVKSEEYHLVREKDISIPEKEFISPRPQKVFIEYQTQEAIPETNVLKGNSAEIFDRMVQYLDGITLADYGLEIIPEFDEASDEEKQEVIDAYLKSFKTREDTLKKEIEEDAEAKRLANAIKFMSEVEEGKIELMDVPIKKEDIPQNKKEEDTETCSQ